MENHTWRGNVRELRNAVERSMIMADSNVLSVGTLPPEFRNDAGVAADGSMTLEDVERNHIVKILEYTGGNKSEAASLLGIGVATLYRKLESWGLKS